MTISAITGLAVQQTMPNLAQINRINPVASHDADGDNDGSSGAKPTGKSAKPASAPKLVQAILQGLSQLGASNTANVTGVNSLKASDSANGSSNSSSKDLAQKLSGFVQTLMDALHSNNGSNQASGQSTSAAQYQQASASIDNSIKSLLDKVTASQNSSAPLATANVGNTTGTQSGVLAALQQSASQLFAAAGVPPAGQSLSNLLQAVQKPLTDSAQVGTIVNTAA